MGIVVLILYLAVFIPVILPSIVTLFIDWISNSGEMFVQEYCVIRQHLTTTPVTHTYTTTYTTTLPPPIEKPTVTTRVETVTATMTTIVTQPECTQYDFRPLLIFLFQLAIYFGIPIILLFGTFRK